MATTIAQLIATLGLDSSDFDKGLGDAEKRGSSFGKTMSMLGGIGGGILAGGLAIAATGATLLGVELYKDVQAAKDAEKVSAQLNAVLKSTGGVAGVTAEQAIGLAESLSQMTAFEDDAILAGENMLLTFTNIGKDIFPFATQTILDMSTAMGTDLQSSAIQLGKALNDPTEGMTALTRVGVTFTDEQKKQIETMQESGDLMGAQMVILQELQKEFGGSAHAAGQTFAGQLEKLKNSFGNIREAIGARLIPILQQAIGFFTTLFNSPQFQEFLNNFTDGIINLAQQAVTYLPILWENIKAGFGWLMENKGVIVAAVAVISAAILAFIISTAAALLAAAPAFLPVLAVILLIAGAAYLLYQAWVNNWGGIQEKVAAVWAFLQPIFQQIIQWFQTNIPIAIQYLSNFWTNKLLPALTMVWNFISTKLWPLLQSLGNFLGAVLGIAITAVAGFLENVLIPKLTDLWKWIDAHIMPVIRELAQWLGGQLMEAFGQISDGISETIDWFNKMADAISSIQLPDWLTPGSPTPFELGLLGINDAMKKINSTGFPSIGINGNLSAVGAGNAGNVININVSTNGIVDEKEVARKIGAAVNVILRERGLS